MLEYLAIAPYEFTFIVVSQVITIVWTHFKRTSVIMRCVLACSVPAGTAFIALSWRIWGTIRLLENPGTFHEISLALRDELGICHLTSVVVSIGLLIALGADVRKRLIT
jgi:hypothetical protein